MELKLQRSLVLQELSILQGVVEHRTTIPILSSILTEAADESLRMVATDLDMTIMTSCPAAIEGGGRLTLESKVFQNLVRNLPEEEFTLRQDGDSVEIECGRFRSRMSAGFGPSAIHRRRWAFMDDLRWSGVPRIVETEAEAEPQLELF